MPLVLLIIGAVAIVVGVVLFFSRRGAQAKSRLMADVPTFDAGKLSELPSDMLIEVKGTLRCDDSLTGELSERSCMYYRSRVVREYEEQERDSKGDLKTVRRSETVASNERSTAFYVEDATGRVRVNPGDADFDAVEVVDRFEPNTSESGFSLSLGGMSCNVAGNNRTLGYRYTESIIPVDGPVYVLGVLREDGTIGAPAKGRKDQKFLISYRSEEALQADLSKQSTWLGVGAGGAIALGVILIIAGIVMGIAGV